MVVDSGSEFRLSLETDSFNSTGGVSVGEALTDRNGDGVDEITATGDERSLKDLYDSFDPSLGRFSREECVMIKDDLRVDILGRKGVLSADEFFGD